MKNEMMMLGAVLVAALGNAGAAPLARPKVRIAGEIGAKFETCLRGNVLKLGLERDFFPPFIERKADSGFIVQGLMSDWELFGGRDLR